MKPSRYRKWVSIAQASPGSDAGCGLKLAMISVTCFVLCITRQRCRVRIETTAVCGQQGIDRASPGSDAGCGLKHNVIQAVAAIAAHHPAAMPGAD